MDSAAAHASLEAALLPLLLIAPFITMRILNTDPPSGGALFAHDKHKSYAHRMRVYVGDDVFFEVAKAVGGFQLSIKKWRDGRDGGSKMLARDLSASVQAQVAAAGRSGPTQLREVDLWIVFGSGMVRARWELLELSRNNWNFFFP